MALSKPEKAILRISWYQNEAETQVSQLLRESISQSELNGRLDDKPILLVRGGMVTPPSQMFLHQSNEREPYMIASASPRRSVMILLTGSLLLSKTTFSILSKAQNKLTAVGRAEARCSFADLNRA